MQPIPQAIGAVSEKFDVNVRILTVEERSDLADRANRKATSAGIKNVEWQKFRASDRITRDLLMICDPDREAAALRAAKNLH